MNTKNLLFALAVSTGIAALPMIAGAQTLTGRDAAISKCVKFAHQQHPNDDGLNQQGRSDAYKACMTQAGFEP